MFNWRNRTNTTNRLQQQQIENRSEIQIVSVVVIQMVAAMEELMEIDTSEEEDEEFFELVGCFGSAISLLASPEAIQLAGRFGALAALSSKDNEFLSKIFLADLTRDGSKSAAECRRVCFGNCMELLSPT